MRFRCDPVSPPTCREDIVNATGWRHVGVDWERNLNLPVKMHTELDSVPYDKHTMINIPNFLSSKEPTTVKALGTFLHNVFRKREKVMDHYQC